MKEEGAAARALEERIRLLEELVGKWKEREKIELVEKLSELADGTKGVLEAVLNVSKLAAADGLPEGEMERSIQKPYPSSSHASAFSRLSRRICAASFHHSSESTRPWASLIECSLIV